MQVCFGGASAEALLPSGGDGGSCASVAPLLHSGASAAATHYDCAAFSGGGTPVASLLPSSGGAAAPAATVLPFSSGGTPL